jgi:uncharacterized small protein (DUF1192 family)
MTTLTLSQQNLINQIITEFIHHNETSATIKSKSLLGVDEIMDSVHRKQKEISRIKAHNEAVFKAVEPIFDEHFSKLYEEFNAMGFWLTQRDEWYYTQDKSSCGTHMKVNMCDDRRSDHDFYINVSIAGDVLSFEGETMWSIKTLKPILLYEYDNEHHSFEKLCQHPKLRSRIKKMYEYKNR